MYAVAARAQGRRSIRHTVKLKGAPFCKLGDACVLHVCARVSATAGKVHVDPAAVFAAHTPDNQP